MPDRPAEFSGSVPENYDAFLGPMFFEPYASDIAKRLKVPDRGSVLELACGTGILTRKLREALPPTARLVATDLNDPMIDFAARKFSKSKRLEWKQADATNLPFEDESFEVVACQFGLMFVPDKVTAVRETYRVLKPGGRFIFNVWDTIERNDYGRTAAYSAKLTGFLTFRAGSEPIRDMPETTIAPQGANVWITKSIGLRMTQEQIDNVNAGNTAFRYQIEVTYLDAFENSHRYRAEGQYEAALRRFIITSSTSD